MKEYFSMLHNSQKAFTMIELIVVVVIIGILSVVAIPRISSERDDAKANICVEEFGNIITEIISNYTTLGYTGFQTLTIASMSNVENGLGMDVGTGIVEAGTALVKDGITYNCEADASGAISFTVGYNGDYNLTITPDTVATTPAAIAMVALIRKNYKILVTDTSINIPLSY
jgi:prepilin-type N-terminal cleavage/methylation domain-containing protein